jgi:hypothetical protein
MSYYRMFSKNKPTARLAKGDLVLCVGRHAYVNATEETKRLRTGIPATDLAGESVTNNLRDGQEVEIVAWRPFARHGLSYQVRRLSDNRECWLLAIHLRRTPDVEAAA